MLKTILKRILQSIPTLFIVITITFVLTRDDTGQSGAYYARPPGTKGICGTARARVGTG